MKVYGKHWKNSIDTERRFERILGTSFSMVEKCERIGYDEDKKDSFVIQEKGRKVYGDEKSMGHVF